jgi:hypothetical protein
VPIRSKGKRNAGGGGGGMVMKKKGQEKRKEEESRGEGFVHKEADTQGDLVNGPRSTKVERKPSGSGHHVFWTHIPVSFQ